MVVAVIVCEDEIVCVLLSVIACACARVHVRVCLSGARVLL